MVVIGRVAASVNGGSGRVYPPGQDSVQSV